MDDKELETLERRIERANKLKREIARFSDAVKALSDSKVCEVAIPLGGENKDVLYRVIGNERWFTACALAGDHLDLRRNFFVSAQHILKTRLEKLQAELAAL